MRFNALLAGVLLFAAKVSMQAYAAYAAPEIAEMRFGQHPDKTRLVLELTEKTSFHLSSVSDPYRLILDLPEANWEIAADRKFRPQGLIQRISVTTFQPAPFVRLEFQISGPYKIKGAEILPRTNTHPYRLVVDLTASPASQFVSTSLPPLPDVSEPAAPLPGPALAGEEEGIAADPAFRQAKFDAPDISTATPITTTSQEAEFPPPRKPLQSLAVSENPDLAVTPSSDEAATSAEVAEMPILETASGLEAFLPARKPGRRGNINRSKPLIVLDAGHGGPDPGATGAQGTKEKTIVLAMALELRKILQESGHYEVALTRDSDSYIKLRDRVALARQLGADLFVSLHADSHDRSQTRGSSVYTLSEKASDAEAAALAASENKSDIIAGVDLSGESEIVGSILIDLMQRETKNLSARYASNLLARLQKATLTLHNAHRFAGFAVLTAPDTPSVLIELGYLSNVEDEALLRSPQHRAKIGRAILQSLNDYFKDIKSSQVN